MSRSLSKWTRIKNAAAGPGSPEDEGRAAFVAGKTVHDNPYATSSGHGKGHAWLRGFNRARVDRQNRKKK